MSTIGRREFLKGAGVGAAASVALASAGGLAAARRLSPRARGLAAIGDRVDPWLEIDPAALRFNAAAISTKMDGKPVLSVLKCNAYGLDPGIVAPALEPASQVWGYAVVKAEEVFAVRDAGCRKPIVMLGDFATSDAPELIRHDAALCTYSAESANRFVELAKKVGRPIKIQVKIDVGLGRLGVPYYIAEQWVADLVATGAVKIGGIFCNLVEVDAAAEHLRRFKTIVSNLRGKGFEVGKAHAASSYSITHLPYCALEMVRPGIMSYGVYADGTPAGFMDLHVAHRLRGRVIRVNRLRAGDGVGYGQTFIAKIPTWTAIVMCGWSDGYFYEPNTKVQGLIDGKAYSLIGRTANTTILNLGPETVVKEGDIATMVGPEPGMRPNELMLQSSGGKDDGGYMQIRYSSSLPRYVVG